MRFRSLRAAIRLLGASRNTLLAWVPASFDALRGLFIDFVLLSIGVFLVQFVGSGILSGLLGWETVSIYFVISISFIYLLIIGFLALAERTLHSAGLLLTLDMVGNFFEFVRTGKVRYDEEEAQLHFRIPGHPDDVILKFAALQFGIHVVWVIVNCLLNASWFFILIPGWHYPLLMLVAFYAGAHWLISHKQFDFDWFKWFGTVVGIAGFTGALVYMVLDHHLHHPHPEFALYIAFAIGFSWATEHTKKYTLGATFLGALALIVSYYWSAIPAIGIPDLSDESAIFRMGVLLIMAVVLVGGSASFLLDLFRKSKSTAA